MAETSARLQQLTDLADIHRELVALYDEISAHRRSSEEFIECNGFLRWLVLTAEKYHDLNVGQAAAAVLARILRLNKRDYRLVNELTPLLTHLIALTDSDNWMPVGAAGLYGLQMVIAFFPIMDLLHFVNVYQVPDYALCSFVSELRRRCMAAEGSGLDSPIFIVNENQIAYIEPAINVPALLEWLNDTTPPVTLHEVAMLIATLIEGSNTNETLRQRFSSQVSEVHVIHLIRSLRRLNHRVYRLAETLMSWNTDESLAIQTARWFDELLWDTSIQTLAERMNSTTDVMNIRHEMGTFRERCDIYQAAGASVLRESAMEIFVHYVDFPRLIKAVGHLAFNDISLHMAMLLSSGNEYVESELESRLPAFELNYFDLFSHVGSFRDLAEHAIEFASASDEHRNRIMVGLIPYIHARTKADRTYIRDNANLLGTLVLAVLVRDGFMLPMGCITTGLVQTVAWAGLQAYPSGDGSDLDKAIGYIISFESVRWKEFLFEFLAGMTSTLQRVRVRAAANPFAVSEDGSPASILTPEDSESLLIATARISNIISSYPSAFNPDGGIDVANHVLACLQLRDLPANVKTILENLLMLTTTTMMEESLLGYVDRVIELIEAYGVTIPLLETLVEHMDPTSSTPSEKRNYATSMLRRILVPLSRDANQLRAIHEQVPNLFPALLAFLDNRANDDDLEDVLAILLKTVRLDAANLLRAALRQRVRLLFELANHNPDGKVRILAMHILQALGLTARTCATDFEWSY